MSAPLPARLDRLLIFPLPEVQLFPHALLPLHVFEPRYRALTRECLSTTRRMAIATLDEGWEGDYEGRPPVRVLCGVGEVLESERYPDGRYDLLLRGVGRARIVEELPATQPYRAVRAVRADDARADAQPLVEGLQALLALCDRLAAALPQGGDTLRGLARQENDPASAADVIASALTADPVERRAVFEELDPAARLDRVATIVAGVLNRFHPPSGAGSTSN
jgi:Lon protease-like protein